jgi:hypothetical protein
MRVCYLDFWPGFDPNDNWFNLLLDNTFTDRVITYNNTPDRADIIIFSCFGEEHKKYTNSSAILISYIGENVRPDYRFCDYSLTFEFDTFGGKNFRLPHWMLYVNWWNEPNFKHARISVADLGYQFTTDDVFNRTKFCSIMIGNPVQNRIDTFNALSQYKPVDGFGRVFGGYFNGNKLDILKNYRFNICFENSITDGYITEKLLEAKIAGCIPIYYGDDSVKFDFNEKCFIDARKFDSYIDLAKCVCYLDIEPHKFEEIAHEPLFNTLPNLDGLTHFLKGIIL